MRHGIPRSGEAVSGSADLSYSSDQAHCASSSLVSPQTPDPFDERRV